jgi:pimeloyl-ACP methyl ester carboxylesterase
MAEDILRTDPRVRGDLGAMLASGQLADEVAMVKQSAPPLRIVHGANDPFIRTDHLDELATELNAGPVRILTGAAHSPQLQAADALAHELADFLQGIRP